MVIKYTPGKEKADLNEYFNIKSEEDAGVVWQGTKSDTVAKVYDGRMYLEYEFVKTNINPIFYFDYNENVMCYTLPGNLVTVEVGSKDYYISKNKNSEEYTILKTDGPSAYIAIDFIQKYTNLEYKVFDNPKRVLITSQWGETPMAEIRRVDAVRKLAGVKSPILTQAVKGENVWVLGDEGSWKKVRTADGFVGYIPGGSLGKTHNENLIRDFKEPEYPSIKKDKTINLVWNQVTNKTANSSFLTSMASTKGLTVVAPTWFNLKDNEGNISSLVSADNVNYAHQLGVEVWATVNDVDGAGDANEVLKVTSKRQKLVNQLVSEAIQYNIDGINVDFELIKEANADGYIQFIRELSVKTHNNGIVLSVDNYPPMSFNLFYNRTQQAKFADYVVVMAYDEHNKQSEEAGSVASIGYVKNSVENTLKEVPAEKLIMGIPFYTRVWKETPKTAGEGEKKYDLSVVSVGMNEARKRVETNGVTPEWKADLGQYYAEYVVGGSTYKIWLEEEKSIEEKLKVMKEAGLAGVGSWKLGLEADGIWDTILKYVN
ncbi:MAG: glycosyl hydrolase family 18 [Lachnospiraceae bacterium]|nr:glycosyl hydrolase family 18 [Lachnospiraceae bacterium]